VTSPPTTAIIAGRGGLPAALVASMGADVPLVAALDGFVPDGLAVDIAFRIERLVPFMRALQDRGVTRLIFAGAASRPRLDPSLIDAKGTMQPCGR
jgi:UDP-2,3-diacylglucosamine hydrolase